MDSLLQCKNDAAEEYFWFAASANNIKCTLKGLQHGPHVELQLHCGLDQLVGECNHVIGILRIQDITSMPSGHQDASI